MQGSGASGTTREGAGKPHCNARARVLCNLLPVLSSARKDDGWAGDQAQCKRALPLHARTQGNRGWQAASTRIATAREASSRRCMPGRRQARCRFAHEAQVRPSSCHCTRGTGLATLRARAQTSPCCRFAHEGAGKATCTQGRCRFAQKGARKATCT
ncbi:hypothetical protein L7F22_042808 [Adiantum nelumboides]|nr:hypothetical protein [Adiantum nelumboides]